MTHQLKDHWGGWRKQQPDVRDHEFLPTVPRQLVPVAFALDIRGIPVLDQGQQGSCTGHGATGPVMTDQKKQGLPIVVPSRAMAYYDARIPEHTTDQDAGASVRDAIAGVVKYGLCPDSEFPYDDQVYDKAPSATDYADATRQEALVYQAVYFPHINSAIASGFALDFGFTVYESFESDVANATGVVPIPKKGEQVLGGHSIWIWGYNSSYTRSFTAPNGKVIPPRTKACRNSWGPDWGNGGDCYLPQWYWDHGQADDHWVINRIGPKA